MDYMNWNNGNIPKNKDLFYWLTVKSTTTNVTHPVPCKYSEENECWINFDGEQLSSHSVVAYYPMLQPKSYTTIGSGCGYYIRTDTGNTNENIYGFGLQLANWVGKGYSTKEKAIAATKRLRKLDKEEGLERKNYEVLDGNSKVVWTME